MTATIHHGDCLDVLRQMPDNSVDAVVTDPPYGLSNTTPDKVTNAIVRWATGDREYIPAGKGFMSQTWDAFVPPPAVWDECFRVLKPGGHLVAFAGDRTQDLMGIGIRLSGMEIRSNLAYLYGSGFPKSHNVHKSTLKAVEERYGEARCDCLDTGNGSTDRHDLGPESRGHAGASRGAGSVSPDQARDTASPHGQDAEGNDLRELRESRHQAGEGIRQVEDAVLLTPVLVGRTEAPGHGHAPLRPGVEAAQAGDPRSGQGLPLVREDPQGERERPARASSGAVPLRGDEPAGEPSGALRLLPSHHRGNDESGLGHDHREREPRRVELDGECGRGDPVARICTWCGLPDAEWLKSLEGVGTATKPAHEPIILARKPISEKTVAANTLTWGTGGLNIDATRIGMSDADRKAARVPMVNADGGMWNKLGSGREGRNGEVFEPHAGGRWPANVVLDPVTAEALDQQSGTSKDGVATNRNRGERIASTVNYANHDGQDHGYGGQGGASRFFKVVEPDTAFREDLKSRAPRRSESNFDVATGRPLGPATLMEDHIVEPDPPFMYAAKAPKKERPSYEDADGRIVQHSTVKPLSICSWLVKLVTPQGGTVLDPFAGSGTTVEAAILEGFNVIGIEREAEYLPLIQQRIDRANNVLPMAS